jgi:N-acetylmuramoyl-L-alanine amidase
VPKLGLDAGHSALKPGARANGLKEEEVALDVCKRIRHSAASAGWEVWMSREDGSTDPGIGHRGELARQAKCNALVSVHLNAGGGRGFEVFYNAGDAEDQKFAGYIASALQRVYGTVHGKAVKRDEESSHTTLSVLDMAAQVPAVLVELGFVDD